MSNSNAPNGGMNWRDNRIGWKDIIKKEARGYEKGDDLGEVQDIGTEFVVTERGRLSKHKFYLPKFLVKGYDGKTLWFNITEEEAENNFKKDHPPQAGEYSRYETSPIVNPSESSVSNFNQTGNISQTTVDLKQHIPLIEPVTTNFNRISASDQSQSFSTGITDWDSLMNKGVRTMERQDAGIITAITDDSVVVTSEGARTEYNIPKNEINNYNGSEVVLNVSFDRLSQYKVKVPR